MSGTDIANAMQLVLQSACPDVNVVFGIPKVFHDSILIYIYRDNSANDVQKTTDTVRRHHAMQVHLLVQSTGDDLNAEFLFLDVSDRVNSAFQANHRLLGTAANSQLTVKPLGSQYILMDSGEYRCCAWQWDVEEQLTFVFA